MSVDKTCTNMRKDPSTASKRSLLSTHPQIDKDSINISGSDLRAICDAISNDQS